MKAVAEYVSPPFSQELDEAREKWLDHLRSDPSRTREITALRDEAMAIRRKKKQSKADKARWEELVELSENYQPKLEEWMAERDRLQSIIDDIKEKQYALRKTI